MLSESTVPRAVLVCASISVSILLLYGASGSPSFLSSGYSFNFLPFLLGGSSDSEFSIRAILRRFFYSMVHAHCFALVTRGLDFRHEAYFMTDVYLEMMWRRIDFLRSLLELGYNFVFTDADIMWFRDPFPRFFLDADFQIACDQFSGNSSDVQNRPNGGFNYVKSSSRSIEFYKFWYSSRETYPGYNEQDVLNFIKFDPLVERLGLKMRFLDTAFFGGLCEPSKDLNLVCTMHANCCFGLDNKLHDLRIMLQDWKTFFYLCHRP
ncbi:hypothetical protein OIU77_011850 [Salix suchowensis]|uniref:Glycosyltransferase n=1 Tax=Salix suchowensis TaxID=1278906 RepID=A0ABQ9A1K5_9ROSI|nr:hypothetical protein OIU77_011850 [Salix suchowensis]